MIIQIHLLGSLFGGGDGEEPAVLEGDDDEANAQFFGGLILRAVAPYGVAALLRNDMQLANLQENSKAEAEKSILFGKFYQYSWRWSWRLLGGSEDEPRE